MGPVFAALLILPQIYVTGDVSGRLARLSCGAEQIMEHDGLASIAGAARNGVLLDNGNLLGTDGFGRYVMRRTNPDGGADGANALGRTVGEAGYAVVGVGMRELAAPPALFAAYASGLNQAGVRITAANLTCAANPDAKAPGCERIDRFVVLERDKLRIGVVGVVAADMLERIPPRNRGGWKVEPPIDVLTELLPSLKDDTDIIIVLSALESSRTPPTRTVELANAIDGWTVLVGNDLPPVASIQLASRPGLVAGTPRYSQQITEVTVGAGGAVARFVDLPARAAPESKVRIRLAAWAADYCQTMNVAVGGKRFKGRWSEAELRRFAMHVVREATGAEVVLLNQDHVRIGDNALTGAMTRDLIFRAFPFHEPVVTFDMKGSDLSALWQRDGLDTLGLVEDKVNGRKIDKAALYTVTTTRFLAEGGDGYLTATTRPRPGLEDSGGPLRDQLIDYLERSTLTEVVPGGFVDLADRPLWTLSADAQVAIDTVHIANAADYAGGSGQPQLSRTPFSGQGYRGAARAALDTRRVAWQTALDLKYAQSKAKGSPPVESADTIRLNSNFQDRRWKEKAARLAPYVEIDVESEFTTANPFESSPGDFHHLLTTGTLGMRSGVLAKLDVFVGAGIQSELLAPGARGKPGVQLGYRLQQIPLVQAGSFKATFESGLDYFIAQPGSSRTTDRLLWTNKLNIQVFGYLTAGLALDGFAYREDAVGTWATSAELNVTVGAAWTERIQTR